MERTLLRVMLGVVCMAGAVLCVTVIGGPSVGSGWLQRLGAVATVVLVAALFSLAAAQAWDRGARKLCAGAILLVELGALLALLDILYPAESTVFRWVTGVTAGAALVAVALCGLVVVQAAERDRWIGRVAAGCFMVGYLALVVWTKTSGGDHLETVASVALTVGVTATAVYSIRARLARLASGSKPPEPTP